MVYIILVFLVSFLLCMIIIRLGVFSDAPLGVQKFHKKPTPRAGGLGVFLGLLSAGVGFWVAKKDFAWEYFLFLVTCLPVFFAGILEDATKRVSPKWRLVAGFLSGLLAVLLLNAGVKRVNLPFFDQLLSYWVFSLIFSAFAFSGVSHAFNIIDGFNGLLGGVAIIVFGSYAYVSFLHGDLFLTYLSLSFVFAVLGFMLWNYPFGLVFLGDGGAYLLGFGASVLGALLTSRHPDVSPWFALLLVLYPVWETLFSVYRKKFLRGTSPMEPDGLHFHMLVYKRIVRFFIGERAEALKRNSYTSPFLWFMEVLCAVPAVLFWNNTSLLMLFSFAFVVFYTWLYLRIVRFKVPGVFKAPQRGQKL